MVSLLRKIILAVVLALTLSAAPPEQAYASSMLGELKEVKGLRVLHLRGTDFQKGYDHGYQLADEIVDLLENYMLGEMYELEPYWYTTLLLQYYARLPLSYRWEITGLLCGIRAARGEGGLYSAKLERDFAAIDILRWNMIEIFPLRFENRNKPGGAGMCSSFSAWDTAADNGSALMFRNLDFGAPGDLAEKSGIIIAYHDRYALWQEKTWLSFTVPGMIGCLTGMNDKGFAAATHYANSNSSVEDLLMLLPKMYVPYTFAVRMCMEHRGIGPAADPVRHAFRFMRRSRTAGSYNLHVLYPASGAAVIEGNNRQTVLRAENDNKREVPQLMRTSCLAVTNHHRKLQPAVSCERYEKIVAALNETAVVSMEEGFEIIGQVVQRSAPTNTAHMIGLDATSRQVWVSFGGAESRAYDKEPVVFSWQELAD